MSQLVEYKPVFNEKYVGTIYKHRRSKTLFKLFLDFHNYVRLEPLEVNNCSKSGTASFFFRNNMFGVERLKEEFSKSRSK